MVSQTEDKNLIDDLIKSVDEAKPVEQHEVSLIDSFIAQHASLY